MNEKRWNEPFDYFKLEKHTDERGFLFEILRYRDFKIPGDGQLYVFSINPGKRRGDHYHIKKREWFSCVSGRAIVLLSNLNGKKQAYTLSAEEPAVIYVGSGTVHALINESLEQTAVIVSYGTTQHIKEDMDSFHKKAYEDYTDKGGNLL